VLFPNLTVKEHLFFFGKIKGLYGSRLHASVQAIVQDVGLTEKINVLSDALSGGMKRKLCLAVALVGNPKFVLVRSKVSCRSRLLLTMHNSSMNLQVEWIRIVGGLLGNCCSGTRRDE
jgi:ABC-type Fe3+/spermidine/putrescine transport system ATPase subunit